MLIFLLASLITYVNTPVVDMREFPTSASKVESQAIYSEIVKVIAKDGEWIKIETADGDAGWAHHSKFIDSDTYLLDNTGVMVARINQCAAHLYQVKDTEYGSILTLPFGSRLEVTDQFGEPKGRWLEVRLVDGSFAYIQRGDVALNPQASTMAEALTVSLQFQGLPYTRGGRSSFGFNCSGFCQMIYEKLLNVQIPRHCRDQVAWEGFESVELEALQPGDLIFFGHEASQINHAGLYLGNAQFIHTAVSENKPFVHISDLTSPEWNQTGQWKYRIARRLKPRNGS